MVWGDIALPVADSAVAQTPHTALWTFNQVSQLSAPNRVAPMPIAVQERFAVDQDLEAWM